jgi:hypothetical protein
VPAFLPISAISAKVFRNTAFSNLHVLSMAFSSRQSGRAVLIIAPSYQKRLAEAVCLLRKVPFGACSGRIAQNLRTGTFR